MLICIIVIDVVSLHFSIDSSNIMNSEDIMLLLLIQKRAGLNDAFEIAIRKLKLEIVF